MDKGTAVHPVVEAVADAAKAKLLLPFFFILISVTAYSITSTDYTVRLGSVSSEVSANLVLNHQYFVDSVSIPLPGPVFDVVVKVDGQEAGWSIEGSQLLVDYQRPAGSHVVSLSYFSDLVTYSEKGYLFYFTHTSPTPTKFNLKMFLPARAVVSRSIPLTPEPMISSDGESIILSWAKELSTNESFSISGMYSPPQDLLVVVGVLGLIVVAGVVLFFVTRKKVTGKY